MTDPWAPDELRIAPWVPGDPLPDVEPDSAPLMRFIDDDGLGCHEPVCWCETGLHFADLRAMRWRPGLSGEA